MLWIKAFHIVFVASWFAGLFYLPRIFVNLAMVPEDSEAEHARLLLMARKLLRFTTLLSVPAIALGVWLWWGIGIVGAETGIGVIGFIGPVVMTVFLLRVSGVPMLERSLMKRREGYAEYAARTSSFIPRPPKRI